MHAHAHMQADGRMHARSSNHSMMHASLPSRWYDDFSAFKAGVRDLEVMLENLMELALEHAPSLTAALELLEGFQLLAGRRDGPARAVARHTSRFYGRLLGEVNAAKRHFDVLRRSAHGSPLMPKHAGTARCGEARRALALASTCCCADAPGGERACCRLLARGSCWENDRLTQLLLALLAGRPPCCCAGWSTRTPPLWV